MCIKISNRSSMGERKFEKADGPMDRQFSSSILTRVDIQLSSKNSHK